MTDEYRFIPDRNNHPRYGLNETERRFVAFDEVGGRSKKAYRHRATERVQALPSRLQDLFYDIEILYQGGYLTQSVFTRDLSNSKHTSIEADSIVVDSFEELDWGPVRIPSTAEDVSPGFTPLTWEEVGQTSIRWGTGIARLVQCLENIFEESIDPAEFIWGQILAETSNQDAGVGDQQEAVNELLEEVQTLSSRRTASPTRPDRLHSDQRDSANRDIVTEILLDEDIFPADLLITQILSKVAEHGDTVTEKRVEQEVQNLLEEASLKQVDELVSVLRDDIKSIKERKPAGIDLLEVLQKIWERFKSSQDSDFGDGPGFESVSVSQLESEHNEWRRSRDEWSSLGGKMTEACRRITAEETIPENARTSGDLTTGGILQEADGPAFTLTAYGGLIAYHLFEHEEDLSWLYEFGPSPAFQYDFERELISNAADELAIDGYAYPW